MTSWLNKQMAINEKEINLYTITTSRTCSYNIPQHISSKYVFKRTQPQDFVFLYYLYARKKGQVKSNKDICVEFCISELPTENHEMTCECSLILWIIKFNILLTHRYRCDNRNKNHNNIISQN